MTYNPMNLEGKIILITGASSGISRAIAVEWSKLGAQCILTARHEGRLQETLSLMAAGEHRYYVADLVDYEAVDAMVAELPKLDGVSHNAGIAVPLLCAFAKDEEINRMLQVNLTSIIHLQTMLIKKRKLNKGASVVFMSSRAAFDSSLGNAFYGVTKSGLLTYARYLAKELRAKGMRSNSICPGMIQTPLIGTEADSTIAGEGYREADQQKHLYKRYGYPEEVAHLAAFLMSDAAAWITGEHFLIEGGSSLQ